MTSIKIHGSQVKPARVDGSSDVFLSPQFSLVKADWEPDDHKSHCDLCQTKFTQIKRRHHCRMCGLVRCAKCCNEKIPLPQLSLEEAERVCDSCRAVVELIVKARSHSTSVLIDAAGGLSLFANHHDHLKKLLELGGLQALVALSLTDNLTVARHVVSGLHALSRHPALHPWLADSGGIKAICKILSTAKDNDQQIILDGIGALMIFCKSNEYKTKVLDDGGLCPVLDLCWSQDEAVCLLAISTLGLIAEHPGNQDAILSDKKNCISLLLKLTEAEDEQIQEVALKTLAFLSTGEQQHRQRIIQEDFNNGHVLLRVLRGSPHNPQILCNASCLLGNLSVHAENQTSLRDYIECVQTRFPTAGSNTEFLCHLTRTLANFSQFKQNSHYVVKAIPLVVEHSLKCFHQQTKAQGLRMLLSLLNYEPNAVASSLANDGCSQFLTALAKTSSLMDAISASAKTSAPDTVKPL